MIDLELEANLHLLAEYAHHKYWCWEVMSTDFKGFEGRPCNCGLDDLQKKLGIKQ
jgi:hypothetical protein